MLFKDLKTVVQWKDCIWWQLCFGIYPKILFLCFCLFVGPQVFY